MKERYENKIYMQTAARKRKRHIRMKSLLLCIIISIFLIPGLCISTGFNFSASGNSHSDTEPAAHKYYKSIQLKSGDTLWDIAREQMDEMYYDSITDYIRELKSINSLSSDQIHEGQYLTVPYYDCDAL